MKLILASSSERRLNLLRTLGLMVTPIEPKVIEKIGDDKNIALENAIMKADYIYKNYGLLGADAIIAADTIVVIDNKILGKPKNLEDNKAMLLSLSNKSHEVITAYCIIGKDYIKNSNKVSSIVFFKSLSKEEIDSYVALGEGKDKAGGYALQGFGAAFIREVKGSITNVIGLPIEEVLEGIKAVA